MAPGQQNRKWRIPARGWVLPGVGLAAVSILFLWRQPSSTESQLADSIPSANKPENEISQPSSPPEREAPKPASRINSDPVTAKLIAGLLDPALSLKERRQRARDLARLGSEQAIGALRAVLQDGAPLVKAAIGEGLGESTHPEAMRLMLEMIHGTDETAARGAIRGLALRGDADSAEALDKVLFDEHAAESVRSEAALALGDVRQPTALASLIRAATEWPDQALTENVIEGLGKRPFSETEQFFRSYLESPALSSEAKVAGVEALANSFGEARPLLLNLAGDPDPEIRAAAAWSLISSGGDSDLNAPLVMLLQQEPVAAVRSRLYEALANQEGWDVSAVLGLAEKEADPRARLKALGALATSFRSTPFAESLEYFNKTAVPELKQTALTDQSPQDRLSSVMVLAQARTAESRAALSEISSKAQDTRVVEAAQTALRRSSNSSTE